MIDTGAADGQWLSFKVSKNVYEEGKEDHLELASNTHSHKKNRFHLE